MTERILEVQQVLESYKAAVYEKNVNDFLSLYDPSARVFDTWVLWEFENLAARKPVIESWFSSLVDERVRVAFTDIQITQTEELAVVTAVGTYAAISLEGMELRSMQNRFTWALRWFNGEWKNVHEHTSVPIADNLMAKLKRDE